MKPIYTLSLCLLIAGVINAQQIKKMKTLQSSGYAPVNGLKMYYEIHGQGTEPLVLIHGGGSTIESNWNTFLPLIAGYGKVIAMELQAHGRTSDRDATESFQQDADDVAVLLKYLGIEKASFIGFSDGGRTTLQIAMTHPTIVKAAVFVAANYTRDGMIPGFFDGLQNATLDNMPEPLKAAYRKVAADPEQLKVMFTKDRQRRLGFQDVSEDSIRAIQAPALFIVADRDVITVSHTLKMSQLVKNAQMIVLPGVHGTCLGEIYGGKKGSKQPEATALLIQEFLHDAVH